MALKIAWKVYSEEFVRRWYQNRHHRFGSQD
jgi:hypothetical protein